MELKLRTLREMEEKLLDEMDAAWLALTPEQQDMLKAEGPKCWPTS